MGKNLETSKVIDELLRYTVAGGVVGAALLAPNSLKFTSKPLKIFLRTLDEREQQRKLKKLTTYMHSQGLVRGSYEHGLVITAVGRKRLEKADFENLKIAKPKRWDRKWRLIIFDIPESQRLARMALTSKLKSLDCQLLQQSVWIHPYPCHEEVKIICINYCIEKWVTYIETTHIDHEAKLKQRFKSILNFK